MGGKARRAGMIVTLLLAAAILRCTEQRPSPPPSDAAPKPTPTSAPTAALVILDLPRRTLSFHPSRDDFTVGSGMFSVHSSRPESVRVNGAAPESGWHYIDLVPVAENQLELQALRIELAREPPSLLCVSVKVWFNEVANEYDSLFYERLDDRYALVSYCTQAEGPDWERAKPRFRQNRVASLEAFEQTLSKPFEIRLNQLPLSDVKP